MRDAFKQFAYQPDSFLQTKALEAWLAEEHVELLTAADEYSINFEFFDCLGLISRLPLGKWEKEFLSLHEILMLHPVSPIEIKDALLTDWLKSREGRDQLFDNIGAALVAYKACAYTATKF